MTGGGSGGGDGRRDDGGRRGDAFHGGAGVQRGSGNLQVNLHEHRMGILSACAVALVCVATVFVVRTGGGSDTAATTDPPTSTVTTPAPGGLPPGTAGADPSVLTGRLVNDGSGLCLRAAGTGEDPVPVQDTCSGAADRTWTLALQSGGGAARTLRDGHTGRCLAATVPENFAPVRQVACAAQPEGQRWELLWGTGDRTGHFMLRSIGPAKCLLVQGRVPGRAAAHTSCGEQNEDQWWHLAR
ncbi:ricin-type beta-trefoil lectin domain protein [Streptomyces sp. NPDC101206]|uniref:ricin-type beta-trefoil lectin domain protein n=1 Tax=Streptomyces sp. NPDC101206 TaxID=3366128 RepID=UPI00381C09DE